MASIIDDLLAWKGVFDIGMVSMRDIANFLGINPATATNVEKKKLNNYRKQLQKAKKRITKTPDRPGADVKKRKTSAPVSKERLEQERKHRAKEKRGEDKAATKDPNAPISLHPKNVEESAKRLSDQKKTRKKAPKRSSKRIGTGSSKTFTRIKDGKEEKVANVTAEQLKKTGLSLRQYMNQWNKTGKRPTKIAKRPSKIGKAIEVKRYPGATFEGVDVETPPRKQKPDTPTSRVRPPIDERPMHPVSGGRNREISNIRTTDREEAGGGMQSGGMIGSSDMSAKKTSTPKTKKKIPQYYKGGGTIKKGKNYAYGGRVAKYKG
tara:strand:+ start:78 stop:1043 length:966 start_codon:yes stop_codon:yes gene_type:complete